MRRILKLKLYYFVSNIGLFLMNYVYVSLGFKICMWACAKVEEMLQNKEQ